MAYSVRNNQIFQTPVQDNQNLTTTLTAQNINKSYTLSVGSNVTFNLLKWWHFNLNAIAFHNKIRNDKNSLSIKSSNWSAQLTSSNVFSLPKNIKFELSSNYITPFIQGPYKTSSIFAINASVSKSFFNRKLRISLVGNDIFKTYKVKNISIIANQYSDIIQNFDTQWFRLSIVYNFDKGIKKRQASPDSTTQEIKSRI